MLLCRLSRLSFQKGASFSKFNQQNVILRAISTSKKNSDSLVTGTAAAEQSSGAVSKPSWQSYGFGINEKKDTAHMHITFFLGISFMLVGCSFYVAYAPKEIDWEQREAFLELRKREQEGLPLVDKNYIDPSRVKLPDESELDGVEIIL